MNAPLLPHLFMPCDARRAFIRCGRTAKDVPRWAIRWALGCVNPISWLPLADWREFTQPGANLKARLCRGGGTGRQSNGFWFWRGGAVQQVHVDKPVRWSCEGGSTPFLQLVFDASLNPYCVITQCMYVLVSLVKHSFSFRKLNRGVNY